MVLGNLAKGVVENMSENLVTWSVYESGNLLFSDKIAIRNYAYIDVMHDFIWMVKISLTSELVEK